MNGTELRPRKFMISLPKVFLSFTQKISRVRTRQHSHVFTLLTFVFSKLVLATRQLWGKSAKSSTHHTNLITWNIFFPGKYWLTARYSLSTDYGVHMKKICLATILLWVTTYGSLYFKYRTQLYLMRYKTSKITGCLLVPERAKTIGEIGISFTCLHGIYWTASCDHGWLLFLIKQLSPCANKHEIRIQQPVPINSLKPITLFVS